MNNKHKKDNWLKRGLFFTTFMYVFMELLFPLALKEGYSMKRLLIGIPVWALAGIGFEYVTKLIGERKRKQMESNEEAPQ